MIWVQLTSGRGPAECEIAVKNIALILCADASASNINATIIDHHESKNGFLSVLIALDGVNDDAFARSWHGSIKWIHPARGKNNRRNWFIAGSVIEPPESAMFANDRDLRFEAYRASGPGGQHVNKTSSAVRVTHRPTGLVAQAQEERSQMRNKALAVSRLNALLQVKADASVQHTEHSKWETHDDLVRGNPIRIYRGHDFRRA